MFDAFCNHTLKGFSFIIYKFDYFTLYKIETRNLFAYQIIDKIRTGLHMLKTDSLPNFNTTGVS